MSKGPAAMRAASRTRSTNISRMPSNSSWINKKQASVCCSGLSASDSTPVPAGRAAIPDSRFPRRRTGHPVPDGIPQEAPTGACAAVSCRPGEASRDVWPLHGEAPSHRAGPDAVRGADAYSRLEDLCQAVHSRRTRSRLSPAEACRLLGC